MAHELDMESDGTVRFAYNARNGDPWHVLGVPVDGYGTIDEMLMAASAEFDVLGVPIYVQGADGSHVQVPDKFATVRHVEHFGQDGFTTRTDVLGVVGHGYRIEQNRESMEFALDCIGAAKTEAMFDCVGVLMGGRQFFAYVRLDPLFIDPHGINDEIQRGVCVRNAHDGSLSLCVYPTNTRVVCWNTATWSMDEASRKGQVVRVRHTVNKDRYKEAARNAMGLAESLRKAFVKQAEKLLALPATFTDVKRVADELWKEADEDSSKRAVTMYDQRIEKLERLWLADTNSGGYGANRWAAWNTITEYLDHHRGGSATSRAISAISIDGAVADKKDKAASLLLAGVA